MSCLCQRYYGKCHVAARDTTVSCLCQRHYSVMSLPGTLQCHVSDTTVSCLCQPRYSKCHVSARDTTVSVTSLPETLQCHVSARDVHYSKCHVSARNATVSVTSLLHLALTWPSPDHAVVRAVRPVIKRLVIEFADLCQTVRSLYRAVSQ